PTLTGEVVSDTRIQLTWTTVSNARSYVLMRATEIDGEYTVVLNGATITTYVNRNLQPGTTYYYKIASINYAGTGAFSTPLEIKTTGGSGIESMAPDASNIYLSGNTLFINDLGGYDFILYSIGGEVLKNIEVTGYEESIDLQLPKGVYILKGYNGVYTVERKIIMK
ncbi:fibronectin type III domain-containing protein, partial [Bacteroidales bacterium OttesenSCG-928-J19]|nr:fibronectin type III domain-containing protein [Bacteroidales bacterium OttesenSCG-928-J19]